MNFARLLRLSTIVLALVGSAIVGCKKTADEAGTDVIRIGEYASLTGATATFGQSSHKGTQMAIDEINAAGGVLGKQLKLITEDDQSKPEEAATVVQKLVSRDKVAAVLGEVASTRSLAGAPICQVNKIPMITPASTNVTVTQKGSYIFRVCFTDDYQARAIAKFAAGNLKMKRAAILKDSRSDYSIGLADGFSMDFKKMGGEIVGEQAFASGDKDFKAQLTAIKSTNPEVIFVPGYYTEVSLIAIQARELGITAQLIGGDGWDSPVLTEGRAREALEDAYFSNHIAIEDPPEPMVKTFVERYKSKYNIMPDAMSALGYDSALLLADALKRAGTIDGEKLRDAIAATKDFKGVTGTITLDENRNAKKTIVMIQIRKGAFRFAANVTP